MCVHVCVNIRREDNRPEWMKKRDKIVSPRSGDIDNRRNNDNNNDSDEPAKVCVCVFPCACACDCVCVCVCFEWG